MWKFLERQTNKGIHYTRNASRGFTMRIIKSVDTHGENVLFNPFFMEEKIILYVIIMYIINITSF